MSQPDSSKKHPIVLERHPANHLHADYIWMTVPLLAMAAYFYGMRPVAMCAIAVLTAMLCDRIVAGLRNQPYDRTENSSIAMAMIVTLLFPATTPYYIVAVSVCVGVLIGKSAFGGYGVYPFNPAALGYAVVAVAWPQVVFRYPAPFTTLTVSSAAEATLVDSASHTLRAGGLPNISIFNLVLGNYAGSMGATAVLVVVACALYLWMRKRITWVVPIVFLFTCAAVSYLFPRLGGIGFAAPWQHVEERLLIVAYELLSGAVLYAAVFLINEPVTMPKNERAYVLYAVIMGLVTMAFRYFGTYDLGVCFAVLAVNSVSGWLDRVMSRPMPKKGGRGNATAR